MNSTQPLTVRVKRRLKVPCEQAFDAFLDPKVARKFLFATPTGQIVRADIDARVGGEFCIVDRRDGEDVQHEGKYLDIDPPHRLMFIFRVKKYSDDSNPVTLDFAPTDDGCEVTLTQELKPEWKEFLGRTEAGWGSILNALASVVEPKA